MNNLKHFTHLWDYAPAEIDKLADAGLALKKKTPSNMPLKGKTLAFCYMNPSLRTQVSCEAAAAALGGHPITVTLGAGTGTWVMEARENVVMDGEAAEHLKEAVPVLGRYCAVLGLRSFPEGKSWEDDRKEHALSAFLKHSTVPVINLESASGHPCQALADLMTIKERMKPKGKNFLLSWAPHVKALPMAVPASAVEIAGMAGMNVTIARPAGYDLPPDVMSRVTRQAASVRVTDDASAAFAGQHVVYGKSWGSMANYGKPPSSDAAFRAKWMITASKMEKTDGAFFMHCLPVRRNLVVEDRVLDGPWSVVVDEAENRLHAAKAVILHLLAANRRKVR